MIGITNAGGGKDRLRFRLFAGQNPPNNPKQADVFVRTDVLPINEWQLRGEAHPLTWLEHETDIILQTSSTPTGSAFVDIFNSSSSNKGRIYETFMSCIQQVSGKWVKREAYVWNNNKWVQFSTTYNGELFYQGNQFTDVTGGWASTGARVAGWTWLGSLAPALEIGTNMKVYQTSNPKMGTVFTNKAIDVTNYKQLIVDAQWNIRGAGRNNGWGIHVTRIKDDNYGELASYFIDTAHGNKSFDGTFVAVDLSNITGNVYIGIDSHMHGSIQDEDGYNTVTIRKMQMV